MGGSTSLTPTPAFEVARRIGLTLPGVETAVKYDGSPVLRIGGCFMAGLAMHSSAEPDTLVLRVREDDRDALLDDAPETYYLTPYYAGHPVVLVRLRHVTSAALHDLLSVSRRLTLTKARRGRSGNHSAPF